jgi:ribosome biogenesis protein MAK21
MYLNLLFRALKADMSVKRVKAFIKRILQTATLHQPSFICGVLYLLSELESAMPSLRTLITDPEPDADDEEVFRDVPDEGEGVPQQPEESPETPPKQPTLKSYDGRKRDPLHADADRSCLWELLPFLTHFHPTVTLFAQHLLDKKPMPSKPDLGMHTLTHFLDRFVYRNPKSAAAGHTRGASIMQPLAGGRGDSGMVLSTRGNIGGAPVNTEAFWKKKVEDIKPEEVFFHRYFSLTKRTPKCKRETQDSDEDEEEEEEQDGEIWKALVDSRPDLEGANDDDGSVDFDDDENLMDMSDDDDDDDDHLEIVDGDEVAWDTDESIESHEVDEGEGKKSTSAALLEAQISSASAKRQRMLQTDPDSEDNSKPKKNKKRKLKGLPTFASAEDYADMLSD